MFGITLPPGVDTVRILALNGRRGKPPCLWEGPASVEQTALESSIATDPRVVRWLRRNQLVQNGVATISMQIEAYSQGRRIEMYQVPDFPLLLDGPKRKRGVGEEVTLRAFEMAEHMMDSYRELLDERDTVIGRLVERGLKQGEATKPVEPPPAAGPAKDSIDDLLDKGAKFLALAQSFRSLRGID